MHKMLSNEEIVVKNMAELSMRYGIDDPDKLAQCFSSTDPDKTIPVVVETSDGGVESIEVGAYTFSSLHDRACVLLVAPRESGKSVLGYQMLATKSFIPQAFVTSTTDGASGYYQAIVPPNNVRQVYSPQYQMQIVAAQDDCADLYHDELDNGRFFDPRCVVVEDDCAYDRHMHEDSALDRIGTSGRHFHIFCMVMVQRLQRVSPTFRDNCDLVVLFANDNEKVRKEVWNEYGSGVTYKSFAAIWSAITREPYHAMVLRCRGRDRYLPFSERVGFFKAYQEEAVDALLGGGEVSTDGTVIKPAVHDWRFGKDFHRMPRHEQELYADATETERLRLVVGLDDAGESDDEEDEDYWTWAKRCATPRFDRFEPSPISITEARLVEARTRRERRKAEVLESVVTNSAA